MFDDVINLVRNLYPGDRPVLLHEPVFRGREKEYLLDCIDSTFVSSVGPYVDRFGQELADYVGAKHAIPVVNGTAGLHVALKLAGVEQGDEVVVQPLSFVATANVISYCGAEPCFVDVDPDSMSLSPEALRVFLEKETKLGDHGYPVHYLTGRPIRACVPMHTFGHPGRVEAVREVCDAYGISLVEDAAESLGSFVDKRHTGLFGQLGVFSFNGNKTITSGGGGAIVTDDDSIAARAKHLTTTAKVPHRWEFDHDEVGFNYRMPNVNAALACAQLEQLEGFLAEKREVARIYKAFFDELPDVDFMPEMEGTRSNYWLNTIRMRDFAAREDFLEKTNAAGVMTRPVWRLLSDLSPFSGSPRAPLPVATELAERLVNLPSRVRTSHG